MERNETSPSPPCTALHRLPGSTPEIETTLGPGETITAVTLPGGDHGRSVYLKIRDRASYAFALASAAVTLTLAKDGSVASCAIGVGGLAATPWRASVAERQLIGRRIDEDTALSVGRAALEGARATPDQAFKIALGSRTVARALVMAAQSKGVPTESVSGEASTA